METVSRSEWGARAPRRSDRIGDVYGISVHYTYRPRGTTDHARCYADAREVQRYHMDVQGWVDGAYSFLVCCHGVIFELRGWGVRTAANGTNYGNEHYHAVCVITDGPISEMAKAAVNVVISEHGRRYGRNDVKGHRNFKNTACPGDEIYQWLQDGRPVGSQPPSPQPPKPAPEPVPDRRVTVNVNMPVLRKGSDGQHVAALQFMLKAKFNQKMVAADGDFGPVTHDAVVNVQRFFFRDQPQQWDGIVGEKTWNVVLTLPV